MKPNDLIEEWQAGIRISVLAHYECSKLFEAYHRLLGYPTVILLDGNGKEVRRSVGFLKAPEMLTFLKGQ